jgi:7,8-dihydropterin-6-yl-methyl-4-(beta-D-ribofuranosyl)aminobenzene 5'-phosphate synthase
MELTVLVDNNTLIDRFLLGEPGLSFFLAADGKRVLFDCGYSDILRVNAARLSIDLCALDVVALSHGHLDHTWGLASLLALYAERTAEGRPPARPQLLAHPDALAPKRLNGAPIGALVAEATLADCFTPVLTREPTPITDRLLFLGEIPRRLAFDAAPPLGLRQTADGPVPDTLPDDTALAYLGKNGLVIVTGCSHAGICNIVDHAKAVTGEKKLAAIIGGLHLFDTAPDRLAPTADYLRAAGVAALYPCHCTGLAAKVALSDVAPVHDVGCGLTVSFD